ncbi:winged helix-turn-helix domain-containing protein [Pelomonas sp. APW6]|uniref:Winged helix-turn-helix domain-containing protein n=1 Tax=Roseateles subflavus TaxID=3053353 RepID=A0ABT7LJ85_9BURK|nr:winged helix-turn-helix domain-containing protein [Pelomonas sp. APW6]
MHARDPAIVQVCRQVCDQLRWHVRTGGIEPPALLGGDAMLHVVEDHAARALPRSLGPPTALLVCDAGALQRLVGGGTHAFGAYQLRPMRAERLQEQLCRLRLGQAGNLAQCVRVGPLVLDAMDRRVVWQDQVLSLTWREYELLHVLVRHRGAVVARDRIEAAMYRWGQELGSNTIEVFVHALRSKTHPALITTVRGEGYQLNDLELAGLRH